jgi:hypothetical protein
VNISARILYSKLRSATRFNIVVALVVGISIVLVGCTLTTSQAAVVKTSLKSGNWSDTSVWGGTAPQAGDIIRIAEDHTVTYDIASLQVEGVTVDRNAALKFDPAKNATLISTANVIINGILVMRPNNARVIQTLKFAGFDESKFVGGGMNPIATDIGLWVMGSGQLDLKGAQKSGWLRLSGGINAGATTGTLESAPTGWAAGDEIVITPTEPPTVGSVSHTGFENLTLSSVSGTNITWNSAVARAHPMVNNRYTAEVANLTRNVLIEGASATARSHIFVRSSSPQHINYVGIRYMGPRHANSEGFTDFVLGRYGLHFHMSGDGSRGSQVFGTVIRDGGSHAFVPHKSHGIWFKDTVAYNNFEDPYWWDNNAGPGTVGDETDDTLYDHAMAALVRSDPAHRGFRLTGFTLVQGLRNSVRDSVAVGVQGNTDASGFGWPESAGSSQDSTVWDFQHGNVSHNNKVDGFFIWQNNNEPHVVANFDIYHNGEYGIQHGAYGNNYHYENARIFGDGAGALNIQAVSAGQGQVNQQRWESIVMDGGGISDYIIFSNDHTFSGTNNPTHFRNITLKGAKQAAVRFELSERNNPDEFNFEFPTIQAPTVVTYSSDAPRGNIVRTQTGSAATQYTKSGTSSIASFAQPPSDHGRPQITLTSPIGGTAVTGTIDLTSTTYDDFAGIDRVEAFVDGIKRGSSNTPPYTVPVNTAGLGDGMHIFELRVFDKAGRLNTGHKTSYWVAGSGNPVPPAPPLSDNIKPVVELFTPAKNSHVSGYYQMTSEATDNFGIAKVEYYADNRLACTDTTYPFDGCLWNSWNTPNGLYTVSAKAHDFNGNIDIDDFNGDVTVNNSGSTTPAPAPAPPPPPLPPPDVTPTPPPHPPPPGKIGDIHGDGHTRDSGDR